MADQTDQTKPLDAGHTTSEYLMTKVIVITGAILGVLAGAEQILGLLGGFIPGNKYVSLGVAAVALLTAAVKAMSYEAQRTSLKKAALNAQPATPAPSNAADAAKVLAGS